VDLEIPPLTERFKEGERGVLDPAIEGNVLYVSEKKP